jgi:hypothetical protein
MQTLGQDLQSGNLSSAQQAFSQVTQDMQSVSGSSFHDNHAKGAGDNSGSQLLQALLASQQNQNATAAYSATSATTSPSTTASVTV